MKKTVIVTIVSVAVVFCLVGIDHYHPQLTRFAGRTKSAGGYFQYCRAAESLYKNAQAVEDIKAFSKKELLKVFDSTGILIPKVDFNRQNPLGYNQIYKWDAEKKALVVKKGSYIY